ncbi:MAG TPA: hypothetical protein VMN36_17335 [Verrucomicrobiales bacterium]|nr:hypothetical protein [Verrucomicrobiales bacterium]
MDITNKTGKPVSVPLPGGRTLFLGPGKTAQVTAKALEHPPVAALLEAGDIVAVSGASKPRAGGGGGPKAVPHPGARRGGPGAMRQSGDR